MRKFGIIVMGLMLVSAVVVAGETKAKPKRDFLLSFQAINKQVPFGTRPKFRLTLKNVSGHTRRVLNAAARPDLQHTYYELIVIQKGKPIKLPDAISDPGPISDTDYVTIRPGATKVFTLSSFPIALEKLPPGTYKAYVLFWQNPYQSHTTRYKSQDATFTIRK
jgi:hypothetical protein